MAKSHKIKTDAADQNVEMNNSVDIWKRSTGRQVKIKPRVVAALRRVTLSTAVTPEKPKGIAVMTLLLYLDDPESD